MPASLHLLVVDDRPDTALFLTEFLLGRRHRVESLTSGDEALAVVQRKQAGSDPYDLVFSDLSMPGLDGLELARALRRRGVAVPFALVTGFGDLHARLNEDALAAGILAVLEKPIELRRVEALLAGVANEAVGNGSGSGSTSTFARTSTVIRRSVGAPTALPPAPLTRSEPRRASETSRLTDPSRRTPAEQPFFGTSRSIRRDSPSEANHTLPTQANDALERKPSPRPQADPPLPPLAMPIRALPAQDRASATHAADFATLAPAPAVASPALAPTPAEHEPTSRVLARGNEFTARPPTVRYQRTASGLFPDGSSAIPPTAVPTSTRIRRSVTGAFTPPIAAPPLAAPPIAAPMTSAPIATPPAARVATRSVACAQCRRTFLVSVKPMAYATVCVHCGQLNRVEPQ